MKTVSERTNIKKVTIPVVSFVRVKPREWVLVQLSRELVVQAAYLRLDQAAQKLKYSKQHPLDLIDQRTILHKFLMNWMGKSLQDLDSYTDDDFLYKTKGYLEDFTNLQSRYLVDTRGREGYLFDIEAYHTIYGLDRPLTKLSRS